MKCSGTITLTTDFGLSDPYVGIMKGVILSINPEARVIDISHLIKAGSVLQAAGIIEEAYTFFPKGTIHVAVVDPGVGTERRLILLETEEYFFVGPDNGIFWPVIVANPDIRVIHLTESRYFPPHITHTFHGRDIFAPVAAHLSRGVDPRKMGHPISDPVPFKIPRPQQTREVLSGRIIRVDHFGNLITNILQKDLDQFSGTARPIIKIGEMVIEGVSKTYADTNAGETLAMIGSSGLLEIAVNLGRACDHTGLNSEDIMGMRIEVTRGI
ncbi:MAG: SAM-dependent chlorinase/fluorinase [Deltaproteobacteria bacterium]|nr:SAM-dependent chlorinase/fluorinase [Deltaproteobacteria bacterium]